MLCLSKDYYQLVFHPSLDYNYVVAGANARSHLHKRRKCVCHDLGDCFVQISPYFLIQCHTEIEKRERSDRVSAKNKSVSTE